MSSTSSPYRNVCEVIVANDFCSGCGICAGVCPVDALKIEWNKYGEYIPIEQIGKCTACKLCLQVCPFWNQEENEDTLAECEFRNQPNIQYDLITGLYLGLFMGYSKVNNHRNQGASGGLTTWFLEKILREGIVNRVGCVLPQNNTNTLFRYLIVDSVQDIRRASRSVYYPVEVSQAISEILKTDGRYAFVGLPCMLKGLRLAMLHNSKLRQRIIILIGLVCGQQKSKFFAEYLCALAKGNPEKLISARFRVKDLSRNILDHRFEFIWEDDGSMRTGHIYQSEGMAKVWGYDYFKLNACNFCDDISAEVADIVFCDAVHKDFVADRLGTNLVLVRSQKSKNILLNGLTDNEISFYSIPKERFLERQNGVKRIKRGDLRHRLYLLQKKFPAAYIPAKRFSPKRYIAFWARKSLELRKKMRVLSRNTYAEHRFKHDVVQRMQSVLQSVEKSYKDERLFTKIYYKASYTIAKLKTIISKRKIYRFS